MCTLKGPRLITEDRFQVRICVKLWRGGDKWQNIKHTSALATAHAVHSTSNCLRRRSRTLAPYHPLTPTSQLADAVLAAPRRAVVVKTALRLARIGGHIGGSPSRAAAMAGIALEGHMEKQSPSVFAGYQKRWFVLSAKDLAYYRSQAGAKRDAPQKPPVMVADITSVEVGDKLQIVVRTNFGKKLSLKCESPASKKQWLAALSKHAPVKEKSKRYSGGAGAAGGAGTGQATHLIGLKNLGNTCFMNSVLQCLCHTEEFAQHFLEVSERGSLAQPFGELVHTRARGTRSVNPSGLKRAVGRRLPMFAGTQQHDAQEFLRFFLGGMEEDLNRVRGKPKWVELKDIDGEADADKAQRWWQNHVERNDSIVGDLFTGQIMSERICQSCSHREVNFDPFMDVSVPIPRSGSSQLLDCFGALTAEERLAGRDAAYCPQCKKQQESQRTLSFSRLPRFLAVHLKRFDGRRKVSTLVNFPLEGLDLAPFLVGKGRGSAVPYRYNLYGVSNHMGSVGGGHYTATCRNGGDGQWYTFDDASVRPVSDRDIVTASAYVLFFERAE